MKDKRELPIFLGVSNKAARHGFGWDLLGVTYTVFLPFFPQSLKGLHCLMGFNKNVIYSSDKYEHRYKLWFTDDNNPENKTWATQEFVIELKDKNAPSPSEVQAFSLLELTSDESWGLAFSVGRRVNQGDEYGAFEIMPIPIPPQLRLTEPTTVSVDIEWGSQTYRLGRFTCEFVEPAPVSEPERRAIASRPNAASAILIKITCHKCGDEAWMYALLDPARYPAKELDKTAIYLHRAPDHWRCKCDKSETNLTFLKRGIHDLFRRTISEQSFDKTTSFRPLYEARELARIKADFQALINSTPREEDVQKFIEANPVIWAFLSPTKILHKPPVLTKKTADFGILTSQKVLYLVEIEKPQTKLVKAKGGVHHEVQKGFDQIRDWNVVVEDHRIALLNELDLKRDEVHDIRYMLVAGRARQVPNEELMKLRRDPARANILFFCFDEIAHFLLNLEGQLERL